MTRDYRLSLLALVFWGIGEGLFFYFQPLYLERLGADPIIIGLVFGIAGAITALSHIPAGILADMFGRRKIIVLAWTFGILAALVMYLAPTLQVFALGMVLYNLTTFVLAPLDSYLTAARGTLTVTRALTFSSAIFHAGSILGAVGGGLIGEAQGIRPLFGIALIFFIISAGVVMLTRAQPTEPKEERRSLRDLTRNSVYLWLLVVAFVAFFAMYLSWPLTPNYLQSERGISLEQIGIFGSLHALGIVISNLALGLLNPRLGIPISQLTVGASVLLIWRGLSWPLYGLGYLLAGSMYATRGLMNAIVETLVHRAQIGLAFGVAETIYGTAFMLAPPFAGYLYERSKDLPFQVSLILIGFSMLLTFTLNTRLNRRHTEIRA